MTVGVPSFPFFGVVGEGSAETGETGDFIRFIEVADAVPGGVGNPIGVGVGSLLSSVDSGFTSSEEEVPFFLVDVGG